MNEEFYEKPLPSSPEAEKVLLGGVLLTPKLASEVFFWVEPEDFYNQHHRAIAEAIRKLHRNGQPIDAVLLAEQLREGGKLEMMGGISTLTGLTFGLPVFTTLSEYAQIVRRKALARNAIRRASQFIAQVMDAPDAVVESITALQSELALLADKQAPPRANTMREAVKEVREVFEAWAEGNTAQSSLKTGIPELDARLRLKGLAKGELTLIAARPSIGKTALLLQMAMHSVRANVPTLFVSLEMLRNRLVMRTLPAMTDIYNNQINPYLFKSAPHLAEKLFGALDTLTELPMYFDRTAQLDRLTATIEYYVRTHGVQLVVFDYLQLIEGGGGTKGQYFNRDAEVGRITTRLKEVAIRTNTAVLGAAQLNRDSEKEHRRPTLADLRESGAIEQAADVVLFPFDPNSKENAKNPDAIKDTMVLELYCAKQRDGSRHWTIDLFYDKNLQLLSTREMRNEWADAEWQKRHAEQEAEARKQAQAPKEAPLAGRIKAPPTFHKEKDDDMPF